MANKNSEYLVIDGGSVKTGEDGVVSGLGIVFGSENQPDQSRERDFFTSESFVRKQNEFVVPLYYNHAIGPIDDQIGEATLTKTSEGWFATARIDTSDDIGKKIYETVKERPHGFSTGALPSLIKRVSKSNGTHFLKKWGVGELSLTESPAERRAAVQSVKSVDGAPVYQNAWEDESANEITVAILDEGGQVLWDNNQDIKTLPAIQNAKTLNIKDISGSTNYTVYITSDDYDDDRGAMISVYEYGGASDLITRLQAMLNVAAAAAVEDDAEDAAEDLEDANEPDTLDLMGIKGKNLDKRIENIVKSMLEKNHDESTSLKTQLDEKEGELLELRQSLAASEKALADLKREQFAEILAGADETIKLNKGN